MTDIARIKWRTLQGLHTWLTLQGLKDDTARIMTDIARIKWWTLQGLHTWLAKGPWSSESLTFAALTIIMLNITTTFTDLLHLPCTSQKVPALQWATLEPLQFSFRSSSATPSSDSQPHLTCADRLWSQPRHPTVSLTWLVLTDYGQNPAIRQSASPDLYWQTMVTTPSSDSQPLLTHTDRLWSQPRHPTVSLTWLVLTDYALRLTDYGHNPVIRQSASPDLYWQTMVTTPSSDSQPHLTCTDRLWSQLRHPTVSLTWLVLTDYGHNPVI